MPCAPVPAQHADRQVDLAPALGPGQPHAYRPIVHGGDELVVERQVQHAPAVHEPRADRVERVRFAEARASEFAAGGPVYERHGPATQGQGDAMRVEQSGELADAGRPRRVEIDQDPQPVLGSLALRRGVDLLHRHTVPALQRLAPGVVWLGSGVPAAVSVPRSGVLPSPFLAIPSFLILRATRSVTGLKMTFNPSRAHISLATTRHCSMASLGRWALR